MTVVENGIHSGYLELNFAWRLPLEVSKNARFNGFVGQIRLSAHTLHT